MAEAPPQLFTGHCSPIRPDEPLGDYIDRFKVFRAAARLQYLENYYRPREARLPSPTATEEGLNEEERAEAVAVMEREIRIENGRPLPGDIRVRPPRVWAKRHDPPNSPFKSLSECTDLEALVGSRVEDLEYAREEWDYCVAQGMEMPPKRTSTDIGAVVYLAGQYIAGGRSRTQPDYPQVDDKKAPAVSGIEPPAKRTRTDTASAVHPAGQSLPGGKRKRPQAGGLQVDDEEAQAVSGTKKRRIDAHHTPILPSVTSSSTRKRKSDSDESHVSEVATHQSLGAGRRATGAKRQKMEEETRTSNAAAGTNRNRILPVTRARRRQLPGTDAQLVQLGERGRLEMQRVNKTQGRATDAVASKSVRKQSSTTTNNIEPETTRTKTSNTKIGAKRKTIAGSNTSNDTTASAKVAAADEVRRVTRSGNTKARRGQLKR